MSNGSVLTEKESTAVKFFREAMGDQATVTNAVHHNDRIAVYLFCKGNPETAKTKAIEAAAKLGRQTGCSIDVTGSWTEVWNRSDHS
jgi:hypothetical protein